MHIHTYMPIYVYIYLYIFRIFFIYICDISRISMCGDYYYYCMWLFTSGVIALSNNPSCIFNTKNATVFVTT